MAAIRAGLTKNVKDRVANVQMTGYLLSQPTPPCFEIEPDPAGITYDRAMSRGLDEVIVIVRGLVGAGLDIGAQKLLDQWITAGLVKDAIESDRKLGGTVDDLRVRSCSNYRAYGSVSAPNTVYLGAEWSVQILASGN